MDIFTEVDVEVISVMIVHRRHPKLKYVISSLG